MQDRSRSNACCSKSIVGVSLAVVGFWLLFVFAAPKTSGAIAASSTEPLCLTTEFLPIPYQEGLFRLPLARELGRQAVLIAARDGLGLSTRDETLGEPFPTAPHVRGRFELKVRPLYSGTCTLEFSPARRENAPAGDASTNWQGEFKYKPDTLHLYTSLAAALGAAARSDLVKALTQSGFTGQELKSQPEGPLPEGAESLLGEMSFVSQYAALREIHTVMADQGESAARLGGLVRGYANLAMLTRHHWSSGDSAFAARSLLYAERMITVGGNSRLAIQHRAYARALIGLHGMALQDLAKLPAKDGGAAAANAAPEPAWIQVIDPFCHFQCDKLIDLENEPGLKQLANQLAFDVKASYCDERWNTDAGKVAVKACPNSYEIYARLSQEAPMLIERQVTQLAAASFARQVPQSISRLDGLPASLTALLRDNATASDKNGVGASTGSQETPIFSPRPMQIAKALQAHINASGDPKEPSWSVLANLIAEEQFIEAENVLDVSQIGVAHSNQELVDLLAPLVDGHRYAPYILAHAAERFDHPNAEKEFAGKIKVVDPRGRMKPLFSYFNGANDENGVSYSDLAADALWQHEYHLPGLIEAFHLVYDQWWQAANTIKAFQRLAADIRAISPDAPTALRTEVNTTAEPNAQLLADWEQRGKADPLVLSHVAQVYAQQKQFEPAIRCYEASYQLSPNVKVITAMANAYRDGGQDDKWLPTMERYFKEVDYALGHSVVHRSIAEDYIAQQKWAEAEPHAVESAKTWSTMGLLTASRVYEGLGNWKKSEYWVREAAKNYPDYHGIQWYLWCRRTGRGDAKEAKDLADQYLAQSWVNAKGQGEYLFVNDMLDRRYDDALSRLVNNSALANDEYWQTHIVLLAKRLKKDDVYNDTKAKLLKLSESKSRDSDPLFYAVITSMFGGDGTAKLSADDVAKARENIGKFAPTARCNYQYFLGELLNLTGDLKRAEQLWREAVTAGPFDSYAATFAGDRLVEKHHVSRADTPSAKAAKKSDGSKANAPESNPQVPTTSEAR